MTALIRRPLALLSPLAGALLALAVLGPNLRGAAAAVLAAAGAAVLILRGRSAAPVRPPQLEVIERVQLGPRQVLVLVEAAGRRYLVAPGASVTSLPLEERG